MRRLRRSILATFIMSIIILILTQSVFAAKDNIKIDDIMKKVEFSEQYIKWSGLSETEKERTILPKLYDELITSSNNKNPFYQSSLLSASLSSKYSLKDIIPNNIVIRNQRDTNTCWAFAGLSSLETNLAMKNYKNGKNTDKVYDYSERHVNYATSRVFANNQINEKGFNRIPSAGGQWQIFETYITNGQGAIKENEMPFENNNDIIDISEIQNKKAETQVYDTIYFNNYNKLTGNERINEMNKIKQHIQNYGSVFASIHGATSDVNDYSCYNNSTGAKYCNSADSHSTDHAVSIIGWDDEYSIDNFANSGKPNSKGAWIARNSWGENIEYDLTEFKKELFKKYPNECISNGWNSAEEIPNSFLESAGLVISDNKILQPIGDKGLIYISYEDCNVGLTLYGIVNSSEETNYDNLYQYDELYPALQVSMNMPSTLLCNIFDKKTSQRELLTGISLTAPETYTCKVYVNPNGTGKAKKDLQLVQLKTGETQTIDVGYHYLEFSQPIEIKSNQYAIVVEITSTRDYVDLVFEGKIDGLELLNYVKTEKDKCFVSSSNDFDTCIWFDIGRLEEGSSKLVNGDSSLKAFTVNSEEDISLNRIEISNPPKKISYTEGENFDKTGMEIKAYFNNNTSIILGDSDYSISNGNNLKYGQTSVLITYMDKTVEQPITVSKINNSEEEKPNEEAPNEEAPNEEAPNEEAPNEEKSNNEDSKKEEEIKNTDFKNAKCNLSIVELKLDSTDISSSYLIISTEITNIKRDLKNDSFEYYYYLSSDSNLKNISNWIKIDEEQSSSDKIVFKVDSRKLSNLEELAQATDTYLYIKETVFNGGNQSVAISNAIKFELESASIDVYEDDVKVQTYNGANTVDNSNNNSTPANGKNNQGGAIQGQTTSSSSPTKLPYTGNSILIIIIAIVVIIGLITFIRYFILSRYVK